jgi:hypothetical protein
LLEHDWRIDQPARLEDVAVAVVEDRERQTERCPAGLVLLNFGAIPGRNLPPPADLATRLRRRLADNRRFA